MVFAPTTPPPSQLAHSTHWVAQLAKNRSPVKYDNPSRILSEKK